MQLRVAVACDQSWLGVWEVSCSTILHPLIVELIFANVSRLVTLLLGSTVDRLTQRATCHNLRVHVRSRVVCLSSSGQTLWCECLRWPLGLDWIIGQTLLCLCLQRGRAWAWPQESLGVRSSLDLCSASAINRYFLFSRILIVFVLADSPVYPVDQIFVNIIAAALSTKSSARIPLDSVAVPILPLHVL